ncbi:glycosyltransferase family 4 protein [Phaeodactylibacter luteus]|uniref:Glycosyltransferase family 4 protein n=1 Tax=Phaeodactylibacter luteus TaxID=1564516 RepID=A0A5C6RN17_9BACT|nr:glycosyltransferase family 4 protein [Phaeodactylibacter luteus]TXB63808.1 glycosyltransferase family 4 protein [Phaeodactylibacter luteus]
MNRSSILFVLESFFPTHRAGTEIYALNLCHYFKKQGWSVSVLISVTAVQDDYIHEDIPVYTFPVPPTASTKELNGLIPPRGIEAFEARLKMIQPDWVHFHSFGRAVNSFHLRTAKQLGFKTAFTPHLGGLFCIKGNMRLFDKRNCDGRVEISRCLNCLLQHKGLNPLLANLAGRTLSTLTQQATFQAVLPPSWYQASHREKELQRIATYADVIFAIAPWIREAFRANGIEDVVLLPQGISSVFFDHALIEHRPVHPTVHFLFLGRMHPIKGFHFLKEAWERLESDKTFHLHIITNPSGEEIDYFDRHKSWASSRSDITWIEGLTQKEVAEYLNNIDVLLLPSIAEVAPLVILEAATRKIPTIASDYIAMKSSIDHGVNGWLFENGNTDALKQQLENILEDPASIMEVAKHIEKPHSMEEVAALVMHHLEVQTVE